MIDLSDLKRKAEAAHRTPNRALDRPSTLVWRDFKLATTPSVILVLIARIEELEIQT